MSISSFSVVPWITKAAGYLIRSGVLSNQPSSLSVNPPVRHKSSVDVPPPTKMDFKNTSYSKLRVLHGSHSTGLNWLSSETQQDGTSVRTDRVIHRSHLVSGILKVPALSLYNAPPPAPTGFQNRRYSKLRVLHGSLSTGLNWLSDETQLMKREQDGTSVSLNPVIHRSHSLPKAPALSLYNAKPPTPTAFKDRRYCKLGVLHGSHSKGLNWLSKETLQVGTSVRTDPVIHRSHLVSGILKVPALSLYNAPPPAPTDFKDRRYCKLGALHGSHSKGLNWLSDETLQDGTSASINHVIHRIYPGSEKLQFPSLSFFMSLCLCPDISGTVNDPAEENIRTETPQPARRRLAGIATLISTARARIKAAYFMTKARITAVYSTIRARTLASMSELQLVFPPSEQEMFVLPSEGKVLLVFPRKETELQAIFKKSGVCVTYTLPEPVDRMWLRFPGPNRELYLSLPQSLLEVTLPFSETEDLQLCFKESDLVLQLYYQGPMARIVAAFLRTRQRIDDFVSTTSERCTAVFSRIRSRILASMTEVTLVCHQTEHGLEVFPSEGKLLLILPRPETDVLVIQSETDMKFSFSEPEDIMWLEFQESSQKMCLTCPRSMRVFSWDFSYKDKASLLFEQSEEAVDIQILYQGPMARIVAAFWRTRRIFDYFLRR